MRKHFLLIVLLAANLPVCAQHTRLSVFEPLINKTWKGEGTWADGSKFKQEILFTYDLDGTIVIAKSKGFTNMEQTTYGERNVGIRRYDSELDKIKFWEFDVFGGVTSGEVTTSGKDILYQYNYGGNKMTDMWEFVNDSTYNFKVGSHDNGEWKQIYLKTQFLTVPNIISVQLYQEKLLGSWRSKAWDGILEETWKLDNKGQLMQTAEYKVNGEVQYAATSKMEEVNGEIILFTTVKDNNPKIFRSISFSKDRIVFENTEYKNPNRVIYNFNADGTFSRTISGLENKSPTEYTFKFKRIN